MRKKEELIVQKAYLILENGTIFEGTGFGATGEAVGEIVFTTGMAGYLETLTDPCFYGQIVVQTFPSIGNYGVLSDNMESSKAHVKAYIVRDWCQEPSNYRCEGDLDTFLKQQNIVGLCGIDTRQLTKIIRENGVMNGKIVSEGASFGLTDIKGYTIDNAVESVTCKEEKTYKPEGEAKFRVAALDLGLRKSMLGQLLGRGYEVTVVPAFTKAERIAELGVDGVVLTQGPGDPSKYGVIADEIRKLVDKKMPIFAVGMGHELLAVAHGAKTYKLKYGHRGANQPVEYMATGKTFITAQNHGYGVEHIALPDNAKSSFVNVNDKSCEGLEYEGEPIVSVQFDPELDGGPLDTSFLYDKFEQFMK